MTKSRQARRASAAKERRLEHAASRHRRQIQSQSRGLRAVNDLDPLHGLRSRLRQLAGNTAEWAGIPIPLEGERLIIEPTYPLADLLSTRSAERDEDDGWTLRNEWYCSKWRCDILAMEKDGRVSHGKVPAFHHIRHDLSTLGCSSVWGIEQEGNAVQTLGRMLRHVQFKQYLLTGMFIESSRKSGVSYIFRKLKPTVAIAPGKGDEGMRILCCLCLHPIGYYAGSWAGAMCPTNDVIAHLSLMRGDEAMFWRRSNQIPPWRPEAGL